MDKNKAKRMERAAVVLAAHFCLDIPSTAPSHEKQASWALGSEKINRGRLQDRQGDRRGGPFAARRWRRAISEGAGDARARRRSESLGCCQRSFWGMGRGGDPIQRVLRVRVGRARAEAGAGPQVCENLRGATRGVGRIGACNDTGGHMSGASRLPRRKGEIRGGLVSF